MSGSNHGPYSVVDGVVDVMVSDAMRIAELTPLPPAPWVTALKQPRERPSQTQHKAYDAYVFPTPHWGLNINLASSYMGIMQANRLAQMMVTNATITTLDLSMCDLYSEGCEALVTCLKRNHVLRHLGLDGNRIGPRGAVALAEYLLLDGTVARRRKGAPTSGHVTIAPLGFEGCGEILPSYVAPHQGFNSVADSGLDASGGPTKTVGGSSTSRSGGGGSRQQGPMSSGAGNNNNTININNPNGAGAADIPPEEMSSRVPKPYAVKRGLYKKLSEYTLDDDCTIAPPHYLQCPLESLSLGNNAIGDEGAVAIMNALRHNTVLTFINLRGNRLTNLGGFAILDTLADHYTLEESLREKADADRQRAKAARSGGKGKGAGGGDRRGTKGSATSRATTASSPNRPSVYGGPSKAAVAARNPIRSCLPDRLRFDMDTLATEREERAVAAKGCVESEEGPSSHSVSTPILFDGMFALLSSADVPSLVSAGGDGRVEALMSSTAPYVLPSGSRAVASSLPAVGSSPVAFGAVIEALTKPRAAVGAAPPSPLASATEVGIVIPSVVKSDESSVDVAPAVRFKQRWSCLMAVEQRYEFLAFNFPALFPQRPVPGGEEGVPPARPFAPNPLLQEAARILFDGNCILDVSLLREGHPSTPSNTALLGTSAASPAAEGDATTALPPIHAVERPLFTLRQHRSPTFLENVGGYFYPSIVPCEGREATLTSPAMHAAPEEIIYFRDGAGLPYTVGFTERTKALRPSAIYGNAACIVAATAMQFIQSSLVRALGHGVSVAASMGYCPPRGEAFGRDAEKTREAAARGDVEALGLLATAAAADDYHAGSNAVAMFGRADRVVGESYAHHPSIGAEGLAALDPFAEDTEGPSTSSGHGAAPFYRYSDHLPRVPQRPNPSTGLEHPLRPCPPSDPAAAAVPLGSRVSSSRRIRDSRQALQDGSCAPAVSPTDGAEGAGDGIVQTSLSNASPQAMGSMSVGASMEGLQQASGASVSAAHQPVSPREAAVGYTHGAGPMAHVGVPQVPSMAVPQTSISTSQMLMGSARRRLGSAAVDAIVPSILGRPQPWSLIASLRRALLPPELLFLESMGYYGGGHQLRAMLLDRAARQSPSQAGGGAEGSNDGGNWNISNAMAPHVSLALHAGSGVTAWGGPEVTEQVRRNASSSFVMPPFGQLHVNTFTFGTDFPNFKHLVECRSPAMSPTPTRGGGDLSDEGEDDEEISARSPSDTVVIARGGLGVGATPPTGRRPLGQAVVPLPLINERLRQVVGAPSVVLGSALSTADAVDSAAVDRSVANARKAYDGWTSEASAITSALEIASPLASTSRQPVPPTEARRKLLAGGMAPSPPPAAGRAVAGSAHDDGRASAFKGALCTDSMNKAQLAPRGPPGALASAASAAHIAKAPHLPPRLPLPNVSLGAVQDAALASLFGSSAMASVVLAWEGGRKDVKPAGRACAGDTLKGLRLADTSSPRFAPAAESFTARKSERVPVSATSPVHERAIITMGLPVEAQPYVPLASTLLSMMQSPMYSLVDPLTALLRGRERVLSTAERASFEGATATSFPIALTALNTPAAVAVAIAMCHAEQLHDTAKAAGGGGGDDKGVRSGGAVTNGAQQSRVSGRPPLNSMNSTTTSVPPSSSSHSRPLPPAGPSHPRSSSSQADHRSGASTERDGAHSSLDGVPLQEQDQRATPSSGPPVGGTAAVGLSVVQREAVRLVNQSVGPSDPSRGPRGADRGCAAVHPATFTRLFPQSAEPPQLAPPLPSSHSTLSGLCEVAQWECEARRGAKGDGASHHLVDSNSASMSLPYGEEAPLPPNYAGLAPVVTVCRNEGALNAVWFEGNSIDPLLGRAITMALQLRYVSPVPEGFNKKALKSILMQREEEERRRMNPNPR